MKAKLKSISILFVICLLFSQLCACSSLNASDQLSDNVSVSTTSKQTKKTKKKATKPATTEVVTVIIEEVLVEEEEEEEETPMTTIPPVEEDDYEEEEGLTRSDINQIYRRITNEYQEMFDAYEKQYKQEVYDLHCQIIDLKAECELKILQAKYQYGNGGSYQTAVANIQRSYNARIQPLEEQRKKLDDEYTAVKDGLQDAIDAAVLEEIYRIENGY